VPPGKVLIIIGALFVVAGLYLTLGGRLPPLGRLPGDLRFERDGFGFYFPLTTSILVSLLISLLFWLFRK